MAITVSPFSINTFKTQLKNGGARPNQFQVTINFPSAVAQNTVLNRASSFLVTVAELPGQTIGVTPVYYRGRELKLAGDKVFAPFTCTVLNDTDFTSPPFFSEVDDESSSSDFFSSGTFNIEVTS